jgi:hypothetical protein
VAQWTDVATYVRSHYKVGQEVENGMTLIFDVGNLRSQIVHLFGLVTASGEQWMHIESPIGPVAEVDLGRAIEVTENVVCGGISKLGELVTLRHTVPLADLDISELNVPMQRVIHSADELERALVGGDRF